MKPGRIALPLVITYVMVLAIGVVLYGLIRHDDSALVTGLSTGAAFGTALGLGLGLYRVRLWITVLVIAGCVAFGAPMEPIGPAMKVFWLSFPPAALFAALAVADRWSLAAFWYPAVVWMLSILDLTEGASTPDGSGAFLLGALAIAFVVFLRARETRRVRLWQTAGAVALARQVTTTTLREAPTKEVSRTGWMLAVSAAAFAFTAWLAPHLWQVEAFDGDPLTVAGDDSRGDGATDGPPCCEDLVGTERARVREYFDLGRGRDSLTDHEDDASCVKCGGGGGGDEPGALYADQEIEAGIPIAGLSGGGGGGGGAGGGGGGGGGAGGGAGTGGAGTGNGDGQGTGNGQGTGTGHDHFADPDPSSDKPMPVAPTPDPIEVEPREPEPHPSYDPPPPAPVPPPVAAPVTPPTVDDLPPTVTPPAPTPSTDDLPEATKPLAGTATDVPEAPSTDTAPKQSHRGAPPARRAQRPAPTTQGFPILAWLTTMIAAILGMQLLRFLFRPLRRAITLRHLRQPWWPETVDQRVSNWWQLVLIGLRDAGWRTSADEEPREFARRTKIDGVDECAAILDRTRHGIRVDQDDLAAMERSAETAYRSARAGGPVQRAAAWIRWPLA